MFAKQTKAYNTWLLVYAQKFFLTKKVKTLHSNSVLLTNNDEAEDTSKCLLQYAWGTHLITSKLKSFFLPAVVREL